ncbi:hypothetical protein FOTG_19164 [Fusarium oxysporum f. sp. vasinfectum 25433]|uniref:Uncharacterized protein n=1 Tax=Fusarium oxysporum f. sp. vasinfectum 25433 TaxID=1089449 RepID=X0LV06_FUSOX|nr:hypothetical protein FOTG_19164 [Fusarium oxysporum f. sp. vasinfectum 25433]
MSRRHKRNHRQGSLCHLQNEDWMTREAWIFEKFWQRSARGTIGKPATR